MANLFLVDRRQTARSGPDAPPDAEARERALDIRRSWIVEAPAGSGKTGLLVQRLLKLLADESVTDPEQALAITFTKKATGELRERVLGQLEAAAAGVPLSNKFERETRALAEAVLRRDAALGWRLLENPGRLRVRTIDAVCGEIVRALPVLSGSGGRLTPAADAFPLHREAARRTLSHLGGDDAALDGAIRTLLLHRDGNYTECERLVAEMLGRRDQWGTLVPLTGEALTEEALDATVLPRLERALDQAICAGLRQLAKSIPADVLDALVFLASEMGHTAGYKGAPSPIALCAGLDRSPGETADHLDHWRALIHLLVTRDAGWRRTQARNHLGFEIEKHHGHRLKELVDQLAESEELLIPMKRVRRLPPAKYPPEQWRVAKALFRILQRALVELQMVFAARGECDFVEHGLLARTALRRDTEGDDLAAAMGLRLQHLLVDEVQDTSTSQYELIERLTEGWDGRSQTVFLVGDPKQSIYRFRQARVERFVRTMRTGKLGELAVGVLRLTANFRSQAALVGEANYDFARMFPSEAMPLHPEEVPFAPSTPVREATAGEARAWHTAVLAAEKIPGDRQRHGREEARAIRRIVEMWRAKPLPAGRVKPWSMAVLVRSRRHLEEVVAAFKQADHGEPIPFRAVEIECLEERREILDLQALTRALLHPADRVAWLAILRAPWCGLTLSDLHRLAGQDDPALRDVLVANLMVERREMLSPDGRARLDRAEAILRAAAGQRGRLPLSPWVERTWRALGGHVYLTQEETGNAERFFQLLEQVEHGGADLVGALEQGLKRLFAETAPVPGAVELLTIHKAKGLEWDVVLVPALERKGRNDAVPLLTWTELDSVDAEAAHVVLAPIAGKGEPSRDLNAWINSLEEGREAAERKRLLYVACTRAREALHLFAAPRASGKGEVTPAAGTLLEAAWPAARGHFAATGTVVPIRPERDAARPGLALAAAASTSEDDEEPAELPPPLHRLPGDFEGTAYRDAPPALRAYAAEAAPSGDPFSRPEGSFAARALGNAVHAFLELLADRIAAGESAEQLGAELPRWSTRVAGVLRADGLPPAQTERLTQRVLGALAQTLRDGIGRWVLANHPEASSERALTSWNGQRASVRLDRVFRAGKTPRGEGEGHLWIVDFKTATHGREGLDAFLQAERVRYEPQMRTYARALAPAEPARLMLYYPLLSAHIWWEQPPDAD